MLAMAVCGGGTLALGLWGSRLAAVWLVAGWVFAMLIGGGLFEAHARRERRRRRRPRSKT